MPASLPLILQSQRAPPICLSSSYPSSLPPTSLGPLQLEGAPENWGPGPRAQQASQAWVLGEKPSAPPLILWSQRAPPGVGPTPLSQLPLRRAGPVQPPLLLPPHSPPHPSVSLGGSSHLLGHWGPHQNPTGALVVGRCELCVLPCCHLDSTPNWI